MPSRAGKACDRAVTGTVVDDDNLKPISVERLTLERIDEPQHPVGPAVRRRARRRSRCWRSSNSWAATVESLVSPTVPEHRSDRLAVVERLLADPPVVHPMDRSANPEMGVWSTAPDCYRFLAEHCPPGTRTLETGSGISTVLFAALGAHHRCVTPGPEEAERMSRRTARRTTSPTTTLTFDVAASHDALPRVDVELDLVLIDGGHGFPMPILDWFYAGSLLRAGGLLVVDDIQLPAVRALLQFVARDPRWAPVHEGDKWLAFRRTHSGSLAEDWTEQPFYVVHPPGARAFARRVIGRIRRTIQR